MTVSSHELTEGKRARGSIRGPSSGGQGAEERRNRARHRAARNATGERDGFAPLARRPAGC